MRQPMSTPSLPTRFRDYTSLPFEVFIGAFTILPILVLIYFYPLLPELVPEYLNLDGEVIVWGRKGFASVFRLPVMAIDLQALCLLSKYGLWQARLARSAPTAEYEAALNLQMGLMDWFRALVAVKWAASSLEVIFLTIQRFRFLETPARLTSWAVAVLGIVGAVYYGYRLFKLNRKLREVGGYVPGRRQTDSSHFHGGIFYYNPADPSWFTEKSLPNFGNRWVYVFLACLICLPLLMFWPMLSS